MTINTRRAKSFLFAFVAAIACPTGSNAAPLLVDLGPDKVVTGVYTRPDGSTLLSGYSVDPSNGTKSGLLISVSTDGGTVTTNPLGSGGSSSFQADKVQGDYVVGWGIAGQVDQGLAWNVSDLSNAIVTPSILVQGTNNLTRNTDVNLSGNFSGASGGGSLATLGNIPNNTTGPLSSPAGSSAFGSAISATNLVAGSIIPFGGGAIVPVVWTSPTTSVSLANGSFNEAFAQSISNSGALVGGSLGVFDDISETVKLQAAVWAGANWSNLTLLTNADGTPFYGEVLGITDDGYAVGRSDQGGFIWNTSWLNPILFNTWAQTELGLTIPTWVTSVNDVFSDGNGLSFALQGSAYLVRTSNGEQQPVPEPSTIVIFILGLVLIYAYQQASTPIIPARHKSSARS